MTVPEPRFQVSTLREGYATPDVDVAVARVLAAFAGQGPLPTRADLEALRFRPVRLQQGYDMGDVDGWFDLVADQLDQTSGPSRPGPPMGGWLPGPTPPPAPPIQVRPAWSCNRAKLYPGNPLPAPAAES